MDPSQIETGNPDTGEESLQRQGSVRRAREMLETGQRPEALAPPPVPRPSVARNDEAHMTQWPLADAHMGPSVVHHQPRPFVPRGPPPPRPRRPSDTPASSVYSERSAPDFHPNPPRVRPPAPSFSQPLPYNRTPYIASEHAGNPAKSTGLASCISISTEEFNRQSGASSVGTIPDFPVPQGPHPAYTQPQLRPPRDPQQNSRRPTMARQSSVSPIPEESRDSPSFRGGSFPSSRAIPSSWGSGPAESEILGAYLDEPSRNGHGHGPHHEDENGTLVRQASLGKRGKPALRTIQKSNHNSTASDEHAGATRAPLEPNGFPMVNMDVTSQHGPNGTGFRDSSSVSSDSSHELDLEKSPAFLDIPQRHPAMNNSMDALEKELELPSSGPNMSDRRPDARRPPRLDMGAVRNAEARGSMTSLPDLIRRATKLATRLDNGRTASRADLCDDGREIRPPFVQRLRNSGSISDILASFPNPGPGASEGRSSWPVFFKKSGRRNIQSSDSLSARDEKKRPRRCCGMRLGVFILLLIVVLIIIALAVLLPVFLVVVPQQNANLQADKMPSCEETTPCQNGGISVSSGTACSCVCADGYAGAQCTTAGDASCVTTEVNGQNATVGSKLPQLFEDSQDKFNIPLDEFSLMALFSQHNVSCKTENALVSFQDVSVSHKTRRFVTFPELLQLDSEPSQSQPSPIPTDNTPTETQALAPRDTIATLHGILIDPSTPTQTAETKTTRPTKMQHPSITSTSTSTASPTTTSQPPSIPKKTVDFARISVLYVFEQTAALDVAMQYSENIQAFLTGAYSDEGERSYSMDFGRFGILSQVKVDFGGLTIELAGVVVGGKG